MLSWSSNHRIIGKLPPWLQVVKADLPDQLAIRSIHRSFEYEYFAAYSDPFNPPACHAPAPGRPPLWLFAAVAPLRDSTAAPAVRVVDRCRVEAQEQVCPLSTSHRSCIVPRPPPPTVDGNLVFGKKSLTSGGVGCSRKNPLNPKNSPPLVNKISIFQKTFSFELLYVIHCLFAHLFIWFLLLFLVVREPPFLVTKKVCEEVWVRGSASGAALLLPVLFLPNNSNPAPPQGFLENSAEMG